MPELEKYRRLAPFSARELLGAANSLLRSKPGLEISERTLRYYISEGLLPPPEGPTKLARYSFGHLVGLVAVRFLQDHGISLGRIRDELSYYFGPEGASALAAVTERLSAWFSQDARLPAEDLVGELLRPSDQPYPPEARTSYMRGRSVSRYDLMASVEALTMELGRTKEELLRAHAQTASRESQRPLEPEIASLRALLTEFHGLRQNAAELDATRFVMADVSRLRGEVEQLAEATRDLQDEIRALRARIDSPGESAEQP